MVARSELSGGRSGSVCRLTHCCVSHYSPNHQASAAGTFGTVPGRNLVCLNDALAITVGDDATGVATAGDRRGSGPVRANVALNEECIEALTCSPATGRRAGDRPPITAVFRTTA